MLSINTIKAEEGTRPSTNRVGYIHQDHTYLPEEFAIQIYKNQGYDAIWSENDYWLFIMGLLFWDVIFAKVKGAVEVKNQGVSIKLEPSDKNFDGLFNEFVVETNGMPADFLDSMFYRRRRVHINNKVKELQKSNVIEKIDSAYYKYFKKNCRCIENWNKFTLDQLKAPLSVIDPEIVIEICLKILHNFSSSRKGLPDLIVFNQNHSFFVEVKSKNDKISSAQKSWINFLSKNLNQKVEIFLINHGEGQSEKIKKYIEDKSYDINVRFSETSSPKKLEALEIMASQPSFSKIQSDGKIIYSSVFNTSEILALYNLLEIVKNWKSLEIEIKDEKIDLQILKKGLDCYKWKVYNGESDARCSTGKYKGKGKHPLTCNKINFWEFEQGEWEKYGHIDSDTGDWYFDKNSIWEKIKIELENVKLCPIIDENKIKKIVDKLPEKVNPKEDTDWGYRTYMTWIWHEDSWISDRTNMPFKSLLEVRGVEKISKARRNQIIRDYEKFNKYASSVNKPNNEGCYIATCVYGSYESNEVKILRNFRDKILLKSSLGKFFVNIYYFTSPRLVQHLNRNHILKKVIKSILSLAIKSIKKYKINSKYNPCQ